MTYILVDTGILLREGLEPHDVGCGRAHNYVKMARSFGEKIDIVTQHVGLGEENFDDMLRLVDFSDTVHIRS